ncbi:MAG: peptide-methionine (S)-S-oxide reductase MsrA [Cyclobacteriaceae bacterium]|nr:peptide-methionine (S)-S-oxide reductase MsrA [Cyclobacteriaceae bacterium]
MKLISITAVLTLFITGVIAQNNPPKKMNELETATLGSGCFWCTEAFFLRVKGIESVVSGYSGGKVKNPTYREVTTGLTGHAEVVQVKFDPQEISYAEVLEIFWNTHDPTTLNRQGNDEGTQYRSVVFYHNEEQKKTAEAYKSQLDKSGVYKKPIVTEITAFKEFYPAEDYHQNYYALNPNQGYCQYVIRPKIEKFNKQYASKLKK